MVVFGRVVVNMYYHLVLCLLLFVGFGVFVWLLWWFWVVVDTGL